MGNTYECQVWHEEVTWQPPMPSGAAGVGRGGQEPTGPHCFPDTLLLAFFKKIIYLFGCIGSSLLRAAFSSCSERGLLFIAVHGL